MKAFSRTALSLVGALALAAGAGANDYVKYKDGTLVKGEAVSYDEATNTLAFRMEDGTARQIKVDELDKRSIYLVNHSKVPKDDAVRQIRVGNLARDAELFAHAVRHYGYAEKADPSKKADVERERALLRQRAAEYGMAKAKAAVDKGDIPEAERWLLKLVDKVPDEPQAKEAAAILDRYYAKTRAERESKAQAQATEALRKDLQPAKKHYDTLVAKTQEGLTTKTAGSKSVAAWDAAVSAGERALAELDATSKKYPDAATQELLAGYRKVVVEQMVELRLHRASVMTTRSSYNDAIAEVNKALALDPKNERALSTRARIEDAAAEGIDFF